MSDALKAREALARLRENLASFDAEVAYELASGGERADLWGEIDVNVEDLRAALSALDQPSGVRVLDVDDLAQEIRRVDGENSLGAGALAEALMPFLSALDLSAIGAEGWIENGPDLGASTPEPGLRHIIYHYYRPHFSLVEAKRLTDAYCKMLAAAPSPPEPRP